MTVCAEFVGRSWATCTRGVSGCVCGLDEPARAARVLEMHNKWRRGEEGVEMIHPAAIGLAIETAIKVLLAAPLTEKPKQPEAV